MTSEEVNSFTKKVDATSLSLGSSCSLAIQFGHTTVRANSFCQSKSMIAVSSYKRIFQSGCSHTTSGNGFLSDISMKESPDLTFHLIFFFCHQFKLPD